jgi:protein gp37
VARSAIEWTQSTWNPVTGCTKLSLGCTNCYAERMARRLQAMGQRNYRNGFRPTCHPETLELPLQWRQPQRIFVNSMSDLFHEDVPLGFIQDVFAVMGQAGHHIFQILTKRAERLVELSPLLNWAENIWMGVTVEGAAYKGRIDALRSTRAFLKFLSIEPLLDDLGELDLTSVDWVIVGGESGPCARPMRAEWARNVRNQCTSRNIPFFFKQWGGVNKKKSGRILDGRTWDQAPMRRYCVF